MNTLGPLEQSAAESTDANTSPDYRAYEARLAAAQTMAAEVLPQNKSVLYDALAAAGLHVVVVAFDGSGDSGQIESIDGFDSNDRSAELPVGTIDVREVIFGADGPTIRVDRSTVRDAIETLAYALLEQSHSGWGNDDGAHGTFVFDISERSVTLDYYERFLDSTYSQHAF